MRQETNTRLDGGENKPPVPTLHGSALRVDVGNSRSLQEPGNSGVILTLPWVVRNRGVLQLCCARQ